MPEARGDSRGAILDAAVALVKRVGAGGLTIDGVSKEAGCAKGLVHYHLKSKQSLLQSVAERIVDERERSWSQAFTAPSPEEAISSTWRLLTNESENGTMRAWLTLTIAGGMMTEQTVSELSKRFSDALGSAVGKLLNSLGLSLTVPDVEIGWLLGAVVDGMGMRLTGGGSRAQLEGAYAAAWLGVLSLTEASG
jgi:AcrR family transcriptional regulator